MTAPRSRGLLILTDGHSDPVTAKTAVCLLRYCPEDVVGILDRSAAGSTADKLLGVGGSIPVVGSVSNLPQAKALVIGIAPSGGRVPAEWRPIIRESLARGMDLISGLHEFFSDDPELVQLAQAHGAQIVDVRKNDERDVATGTDIRSDCLRILTVGHDCSVGKMVAAVELERALRSAGESVKFIATGQTGIMIAGDGCPVDRVISDFLAGAVEKLLKKYQQHDTLIFEGQGNLAHPKYSAVTLGLMHGCRPQGMIMVYEAGRTHVHGMEHVPLRPLRELIPAYEMAAGLVAPSKVIAIAANTRRLSQHDARREMERMEAELGLPTCDVIRDGAQRLADIVRAKRAELLELGRERDSR